MCQLLGPSRSKICDCVGRRWSEQREQNPKDLRESFLRGERPFSGIPGVQTFALSGKRDDELVVV